ncbi:MAG: NAD(P)H-binding protein [Thauera sp.]
MYLVNGVGGQLASRAAEEILNHVPAKELVFCASRLDRIDPVNLMRWRDRGVTIREASYDNPEQLHKAYEGVERMLLVSTWMIGPTRQQQHANAIDAAKRAGVEHIVYTSFVGAEIETDTPPVALDHRITEKNIIDSGLKWSFMRDTFYADAVIQYFPPLATLFGNLWRSNTGRKLVGYVAREDCSKVAAALLAGKGEPNSIHVVTGPELLSDKDIFDLICARTGWTAEFVDLSDEDYYAFWDSHNVPRSVTGDFSKSPIPLCSDDLVTNGTSIRAGHHTLLTDTVEKLTGCKPLSARTVLEKYIDQLPKG